MNDFEEKFDRIMKGHVEREMKLSVFCFMSAILSALPDFIDLKLNELIRGGEKIVPLPLNTIPLRLQCLHFIQGCSHNAMSKIDPSYSADGEVSYKVIEIGGKIPLTKERVEVLESIDHVLDELENNRDRFNEEFYKEFNHLKDLLFELK